eukprot:XP_027321823.1 mitotic-spindle organizing protein 2-like isoform X1 [Anas platyrhynchos]
MSGAALGKAAAAAAARPRRKVLSAEEAELFELAQAAGSGLDPEVFKVLLDLLRMNVAPLAVFQVLKSMCAGQRLPAASESGAPAAPAPLPADSREPPQDPLAFASALRLPRPSGVRPPRCLLLLLLLPPAAPLPLRAARRPRRGLGAGGSPLGLSAAPGRGVRAGRQGPRLLLAARPGGGAGPRGPPPTREARGARSV